MYIYVHVYIYIYICIYTYGRIWLLNQQLASKRHPIIKLLWHMSKNPGSGMVPGHQNRTSIWRSKIGRPTNHLFGASPHDYGTPQINPNHPIIQPMTSDIIQGAQGVSFHQKCPFNHQKCGFDHQTCGFDGQTVSMQPRKTYVLLFKHPDCGLDDIWCIQMYKTY